jgi:hypothetical protein
MIYQPPVPVPEKFESRWFKKVVARVSQGIEKTKAPTFLRGAKRLGLSFAL